MESERWQRVKELFEGAAARPAAERRAWLEDACAGDDELRAEVESLLTAAGGDDSLLDHPLELGQLDPDADRETGALAGRTLGPWRLLSLLGHGGMGAVYLAERAEGDFEQRVAVKLVKRGLDTDAVLERFRQERQILAGLEHPYIARLLDGGATDEGLPYFVMEHVEGTPIDRYCDDHRLSTIRRLELFGAVCAAVQYAHQNLIVHRDLKPGNILVNDDGLPKLLDFGIAKLLGPDLSAPATRLTAAWARPLTPEYASPEQLRGEPVSVASDVYSLGVLLYQLLTGHLPYRVGNRSPEAVARLVKEAEPLRPSTVVGQPTGTRAAADGRTPEELAARRNSSPARLRRGLVGDLDNILLKALAKVVQDRYASVEQLAEDLRRHLEGLPVAARGQTLAYRAAKFVRRHRAGATATAVVLLLVLALIALSVRYTADLGRERNLAREAQAAAEQREREATEVTDFLVELFEVSDPGSARGETITAREILERGAEEITTELADQPLTQAALMTVIGRVNKNLGLYAEAAELLEGAVEIRRELLGGDDLAVAESQLSLAHLRQEEHRYGEAEDLYRQVLAIRQEKLGEDHRQTALIKKDLAGCLRFEGELDEADRLSREALGVLHKDLGEDHPQVLGTLQIRAQVLRARGEVEEARALYLDLLARQRRALGSDHPQIPGTLNSLGFLHRKLEEFAEAERYYRESLDLLTRLVDESHPNAIRVRLNLASALHFQGKAEETERHLRRVVELRRRSLPPDDPLIGSSLVRGLGNFLMEWGRWREAEGPLREGLAVFESGPGGGGVRTALAKGFLAACLLAQHRDREASEMLRPSLAVLTAEQRFRPATWGSVEQIIGHLEAAGREDQAERYRALLTDERRPLPEAQ